MNLKALIEGPRDPDIFKAVFTAGIPGAGKTTIVKKLTDGTGLKTVSFDELYEFMKKRGAEHHQALGHAGNLLSKKLNVYLDGRLGLIIDKTSWDYNKIRDLKTELEEIGYGTFMVYVNTDLQTAKARVADRFTKTGRPVDGEYIDRVFKKLSTNIGKYQQDFSDQFVIIDNSQSVQDPRKFDENLRFAQKKLNKFLSAKPNNQMAADWIKNAT